MIEQLLQECLLQLDQTRQWVNPWSRIRENALGHGLHETPAHVSLISFKRKHQEVHTVEAAFAVSVEAVGGHLKPP